MIRYLAGTILTVDGESVTLLVQNGVGYMVFLSASDITRIREGDPCSLFCYHHITERSQELYGFFDVKTRELFSQMISSVSGVGPKSSLKIIGKVPFDALITAVKKQDPTLLEEYKIGKKTADKLILGLNGIFGATATQVNALVPLSEQKEEAMTGLIRLGYTEKEARDALKLVTTKDQPVEIILKNALKNL